MREEKGFPFYVYVSPVCLIYGDPLAQMTAECGRKVNMMPARKPPACVRALMTAMLLVLVSTGAWAATTGRIAGTVVDAEGAPIAGAGVTVQGTRLGATTDANGRYFVLQVPPGEHTVSAMLIGYRTTTVTGVRVSADLTTEVAFRLFEEAIEVEAMVVTAARDVLDADVTSSQIVVDAEAVSEMPVSTMLNMLSYEPGVMVDENNELSIRGGGPSEIQFQVDGMARTDAITSKGQTQLNQVLVAEVTVLTGGFNAEYGNVRSGVVNAVLRDGSEGGTLPSIQGAISYAPAQQKHFGPGAYDEDQYDYWIMSSASPFADRASEVNNFGEIYWPYLYEETANHQATIDAITDQAAKYRAISGFLGWDANVQRNNQREIDYLTLVWSGSYNKNNWTAEELREAWEYEANMNEQAWSYADRPDINADLAASWALPNRMGGIIFGYSYNRVMTPVPARVPYARDIAYDAKLTLTPLDGLKLSLRYYRSESYSTGGGSMASAAISPELEQTGVTPTGGDPVSLRSVSDLAASLNGDPATGNKLNLSYNAPMTSTFDQIVGSFTYTIGSNTFLTGYLGRSHSDYVMERDLPRADMENFTGRWKPNFAWAYQGFLSDGFGWTSTDSDTKGDPPVDMQDALDPTRIKFRPNYMANVQYEVPTETIFEYREFPNMSPAADGNPVRVVSPQGYATAYTDLAGVNTLAGGGEVRYDGNATTINTKFDVTYATGSHTFKTGLEFSQAELEYHYEQVTDVMSTMRNTEFRDYGGNWPTPTPTYLGVFAQDKFESQGMIANIGVRLERFNGGQDAYCYNNFFEPLSLSTDHGSSIYDHLDLALDGVVDGLVPDPWDIINSDLFERSESVVHWRVAPRFGISHPVSQKSKFFFNFGQFYSAQKAAVMYGLIDHDTRLGYAGTVSRLPNPNLRPARTTAYEVGVEHVFPWRIMMTLRGYAKFNTDQVSGLAVSAQGWSYTTYRNRHFEDIRGLEIKIARTGGRFLNGWFTYERSRTQEGLVGENKVVRYEQDVEPFVPWTREARPVGTFQGTVVLSTPRDWGALRGGWSMTVVQDYEAGEETHYNPDPSTIPLRELPEENWFPEVDYWNTNLKFSKTFDLPGGRFMAFSFDIENLWNTRRLNGGAQDETEYTKFIYEQRMEYARRKAAGVSTEGVHNYKWGDPDTFYIFTRPWQTVPSDTVPYYAPLTPRLDYLLCLYPRFYRFGVRFSL